MTYQTGTVTVSAKKLEGAAVPGNVQIIPIDGDGNQIPAIVDAAGNRLLTGEMSPTVLAKDGTFTVDLPATDDATLVPTGFGYRCTVTTTSRTPYVAEFALPGGQTVDFTDVYDPAVPPVFNPTVPYASAAALAAEVTNRVAAIAAKTLADVAATATASGNVVVGKHNPFDTTAAALTATVPDAAAAGELVAIENTTAVHVLTVSCKLRGNAGTLPLTYPNETLLLESKADGSWWPISGHRTKTSITNQIAGPPAYAGFRVNRYDQQRNVYNWKPSNTRKLRASLGRAASGVGLAHHAFIGDSETANAVGTITGTPQFDHLHMWPVNYRDTLAALGIPAGGTGIVIAPQNPTASGLGAMDPRWVATSGSWANGGFYLDGTANGSVATFTSDKPGKVVDLWFYGNSGSFTIAIDGGAPVAATRTGTVTVNRYTVTGLANTTHTVTITTTSATSVKIIGAMVSGDSGLLIHNLGSYGMTAQIWATSGVGSIAFGREGTLTAAPSLALDALFLKLGVNDNTSGRSIAQFKADIQTIRARVPGGDLVLVGQYEPQTPVIDWQTWSAGMYDLADTFDCPYIDLYDRTGGYAIANGNGLMGDVTHPNKLAQREDGRNLALVVAG